MPSDEQLVARCLAGDQEAWNDLVRGYSRYVFAICSQGYRLQGADAEDAFQDVFVRVYGRLGSLRNPEALRPWIAQLTRRVCLEELPEECQEVLERFFCRDESYRTIGEELGIPSGTIASRISRCLARLRQRLEA